MWMSIVPAMVLHGAGADSESFERLGGSRLQPRVRRQPEIVVRREVHDRPVVERGVSLLLVLEDSEPAIEILLFQRVELVSKVAKRIGAHLLLGSRFSGSRFSGSRVLGFGVRRFSQELRAVIHSVHNTCRIAAVGTARMAPAIPSRLPPMSNATMTVTALTPTWRSMTFGTRTWFSNCCWTTKKARTSSAFL